MEIRIRTTGAIMNEPDFREYLKNKGSGAWNTYPLSIDVINEFEADVVLEGPQASGGTVYQYSQRDGVEQIDGKWYTKYILGPIFTDNEDGTAAEQEAKYKATKDAEQAERVREFRNKRLAECDWTQLADSPVDKAVWATYRQELRDITKQDGFPWTVTWPDKP